MTFPGTQVPITSAALAWSEIQNALRAAQFDLTELQRAAQAESLITPTLALYAARIRVWLADLAANVGVPGLQAYARIWSGVAAFDLSVEYVALRAALLEILGELRVLHGVRVVRIAADGEVLPGLDGVSAAAAATLIAKITAFLALIA